ncbi:MAG: GNAT family N-acetyltransferase [Nannocystaceae bacterium]|nr:GNAT family N-acetyltransferase [bacterium]
MTDASDRAIVLRPLTDADRQSIARWRYPGDLAIYDPGPGAFDLRAPDHVALASDGDLVGYATLGTDAQVPGGDYGDSPGVLDVGLGIRPDLVGAGLGRRALTALLREPLGRRVERFRVTVAAANPRATALVVRLGFEATHRFQRPSDGRAFVQYEREAPSPAHAAETESTVVATSAK